MTRKLFLLLYISITSIGTSFAQKELSENMISTPKTEKMIVTSHNWEGDTLPQYPEGKPQISIIRYTIQPHSRMKTL